MTFHFKYLIRLLRSFTLCNMTVYFISCCLCNQFATISKFYKSFRYYKSPCSFYNSIRHVTKRLRCMKHYSTMESTEQWHKMNRVGRKAGEEKRLILSATKSYKVSVKKACHRNSKLVKCKVGSGADNICYIQSGKITYKTSPNYV